MVTAAMAALGCRTRGAQGCALPFCPHPHTEGGERGSGVQQNCSEKGGEAGEGYGTQILGGEAEGAGAAQPVEDEALSLSTTPWQEGVASWGSVSSPQQPETG